MSGVEVVGLVLGAIPLLVSGLEHYGEGVRTIKKFFGAAEEFEKLKVSLECEERIFLNGVESLLQYGVDDRVLADFIDGAHNGTKRSNESLERSLRQILGRSYTSYVATAQRMNFSIQQLQESLQLGSDGKGPFVTSEKRSVTTALKSIKFGLKMRAYAEMMRDITTHNNRLYQLTNQVTYQNRSSVPTSNKRTRAPDFEKARKHAEIIFSTLQRSLAGSCGVAHRASLYMRPTKVSGTTSFASNDSSRFRVVLHHQVTSSSGAMPPWVAAETEIRPMENVNEDEHAVALSTSGVRFQVATGVVASSAQAPSVVEIRDLCMSLKQPHLHPRGECDVCLGYLLDATRGFRHGLYWPDRPLVDQASPQTFSLADLLDRAQGHKLAESDKRQLALALACGLLRLYETPWLAGQWGKRDVLLFRRGGHILTSHPFISTEIPLTSPQQTSVSSSRRSYFTPCRLIKEETIFALGLVLIELAMEQPFEMLHIPADLNPDGTKHQLSDYYAADRLVEEAIAEKAGDRYANVVRRCIQCQFDEQKHGLSSAVFRRKFYEGVVVELELELEDLNDL